MRGERIAVFWSRVAAEPAGCWWWTGTRNGSGYGSFSMGRTLRISPHRLVMQLLGHDLTSLTVDHLCFNKLCCNPDHLEVVTMQVNSLRGNSKSAQRARQTHCLRGHEFTDENTYLTGRNQRICRECIRIRARRRYHEQKAKAQCSKA